MTPLDNLVEFSYFRKGCEIINSGKKFENAIKAGIPNYCIYYRLPDAPQSFNQSSSLRFSWKNPCDCFIFDTHSSIFYAIEMKTTKNGAFSFEEINIEEKQPPKMIHKHQILALLDYAKYNNVEAGFLFNFRNEKSGTESTYFQNINDFMKMINGIRKKSFNENDLLKYNPTEITGKKKRINYTWDIDKFLVEMR